LTNTYLQLLFNLTDLLTPTTGVFPLTNIKPETVRKMKKVRLEAWKEIKESYAKEHPAPLPAAGAVVAGKKESSETTTTTEPAVREYVEWKDDDDEKDKKKKKPNAAERKAVSVSSRLSSSRVPFFRS